MEKQFIETLGLFNDNPDSELSPNYWDEYNFRIDSVLDYTKGYNDYALIVTNDKVITIAIKYDKFKKIMMTNIAHLKYIFPEALYQFKEQN